MNSKTTAPVRFVPEPEKPTNLEFAAIEGCFHLVGCSDYFGMVRLVSTGCSDRCTDCFQDYSAGIDTANILDLVTDYMPHKDLGCSHSAGLLDYCFGHNLVSDLNRLNRDFDCRHSAIDTVDLLDYYFGHNFASDLNRLNKDFECSHSAIDTADLLDYCFDPCFGHKFGSGLNRLHKDWDCSHSAIDTADCYKDSDWGQCWNFRFAHSSFDYNSIGFVGNSGWTWFVHSARCSFVHCSFVHCSFVRCSSVHCSSVRCSVHT